MHEIKLANEANGPKIMALLDPARKSENTQRSLTVDCSEILDLSAEARRVPHSVASLPGPAQ